MGIRFAEKIQPVLVHAPQVTTADDMETTHVLLENAHWLSFLVSLGAITTDSSDSGTILLYSSTAASTTNAIAQTFKYRLCEALGGDTFAAVGTGTAAGYTFTATDDNKMIMIDVDPSELLKLDPDAKYAHLNINGALLTGTVASVVAFIEPRYPKNVQVAST